MRKLLMLAAVAAVSVACHNRSEDEVGTAPDRGDTTAVTHAIDSTRTGPPGVGGRPGDATITLDSVGVDSAAAPGNAGGYDTTATPAPGDTLDQGTSGAGTPDSSAVSDSMAVPSDSATGQ